MLKNQQNRFVINPNCSDTITPESTFIDCHQGFMKIPYFSWYMDEWCAKLAEFWRCEFVKNPAENRFFYIGTCTIADLAFITFKNWMCACKWLGCHAILYILNHFKNSMQNTFQSDMHFFAEESTNREYVLTNVPFLPTGEQSRRCLMSPNPITNLKFQPTTIMFH